MSKYPGPGLSKLSISSTETGSRVLLDDQDISRSLSGLVLTLGGGERSTVRLDVFLPQAPTTELADAVVEIPTETAALLVQLGWTPPTEETTS